MNTREYVLKHIRSVRAKLYVILNEISKRVSQHDKSKLESTLEECKKDFESNDIDVVKSALEKLTNVSNEVFSKLYSQGGTSSTGNQSTGADDFEIHDKK